MSDLDRRIYQLQAMADDQPVDSLSGNHKLVKWDEAVLFATDSAGQNMHAYVYTATKTLKAISQDWSGATGGAKLSRVDVAMGRAAAGCCLSGGLCSGIMRAPASSEPARLGAWERRPSIPLLSPAPAYLQRNEL